MSEEIYIVEWKLTNPDDESFKWRREKFEYKWRAENFIQLFNKYASALHIGIAFKMFTNIDATDLLKKPNQ